MGEVCEVGLKTLGANFRVEELFSAQNVSRYFPCRKPLVISTPNWIILCNCLEDLLVYLYHLDVFLYVPGIGMNILLNLLQVDFTEFFPCSIFIVLLAGQKLKMKEIFISI